jgi:hypothetical protein
LLKLLWHQLYLNFIHNWCKFKNLFVFQSKEVTIQKYRLIVAVKLYVICICINGCLQYNPHIDIQVTVRHVLKTLLNKTTLWIKTICQQPLFNLKEKSNPNIKTICLFMSCLFFRCPLFTELTVFRSTIIYTRKCIVSYTIKLE